ncbi:MAG: hypothetical protein WDW38_006150 [Sanguina aurantia]
MPGLRLDGVTRIHVDAVRLPRNFQLAHDAKLVVSRPHSTPFGELVVHRDRCDGEVVATMALQTLSWFRREIPNPNPKRRGTAAAPGTAPDPVLLRFLGMRCRLRPGDAAGQRSGRLGPRLRAAGSFGLEWLHADRPDLSALPVRGRRVGGTGHAAAG